jgi:hypothetical protein
MPRKNSKPSDAKPSDAKPKLLSGGNPQIPKGNGDASVQAYLAAMPGWKHDVGLRLDQLIMQTVPEVQKAVRWNTPFYGTQGNGWFLGFHCATKYIKVAFFKGAALDPLPPVDSKQTDVRYLHLHEADQIGDDLITNWIRQAAEFPGAKLF